MKEMRSKPPPHPLSDRAWFNLCVRLCAQLLPAKSSSSSIERNLIELELNPIEVEWGSKQQEHLFYELYLCRFYEPIHEPGEDMPQQIEELFEKLVLPGLPAFALPPLKDLAISALLGSTTRLTRETRQYLAEQWMNRQPLLKWSAPDPRRQFAESVKNLKTLLGTRGLSQAKADDMITAGLGLPSADALRKRLQPKRSHRARRD